MIRRLKECSVCCVRLADSAVDHVGSADAHHPAVRVLLSVLSAEVLLLRALPLLPADLLLPREGFVLIRHSVAPSWSTLTP